MEVSKATVIHLYFSIDDLTMLLKKASKKEDAKPGDNIVYHTIDTGKIVIYFCVDNGRIK